MPKQRIHIENVRLRLPRGAGGVAVEARDLAHACGREILRGIAESGTGRAGTVRIDEVKTGTIRAAGGTSAIPRQVAERVAIEVRKRLGREGAR